GLGQDRFELLALACRAAGLDSYVRLAPTDYASVMRPMEAGVGGIMAAQVRTPEEVRRIASWTRYPPLGIRGLNLSNREGKYANVSIPQLIEEANRERWLSVQIETAEALEQVEAIAAIDGVDHLFVGPADLSIALGVPGDFLNPKCLAAIDRIAAAVKKAGKSWGGLVRGKEHAAAFAARGCQLFAPASDVAVINAGFKALRGEYAELFSAPGAE
ncbi:MAG TPA: aldolase/citrate lyase family protein, partial [Planctomycetia bacterium]|nr:aldolase/citrate lyase family protein [Planctomycetia bacterium]